jgi:hypothetical protein
MSAREKLMCGCETCIIFNDMHECLNLFWKRYITRMKRELQGIRDGCCKFDLLTKLETYIHHVCSNPNDHKHDPKYKSGWYAASMLGCPLVTIDDRCYQFKCTPQECTQCCNSWAALIPMMEQECTEGISYVIFGTHIECSYHSDGSMQVKGKESFCMQCESMPDEKRGNLKGGIPKVKQVKLRIVLMEPINKFIGPGGTYEKHTWRMFQHQMHVKLLGSKFGVRICYNHFKQNDGVVVTEMDYSKRYKPIPMREIQSKNFGRDADVSIEIHFVSLQDKDME